MEQSKKAKLKAIIDKNPPPEAVIAAMREGMKTRLRDSKKGVSQDTPDPERKKQELHKYIMAEVDNDFLEIVGVLGITRETAENVAKGVLENPGRNDPCPCGSGKKFKRCCGK